MLTFSKSYPVIRTDMPFLLSLPKEYRVAILRSIPKGVVIVDICSNDEKWRIANYTELRIFFEQSLLLGFLCNQEKDFFPHGRKIYIFGQILYDFFSIIFSSTKDKEMGDYVFFGSLYGFKPNQKFHEKEGESEFIPVRANENSYVLCIKKD